ncbi:MAG: hypothetical protein ACK4YP_08900, partial [Myxococcota bacterium]
GEDSGGGGLYGLFLPLVPPLPPLPPRAGFGYGAPCSVFDPARAEHARLTFHTLDRAAGPPAVAAARVQRRNLYTLARYESWSR